MNLTCYLIDDEHHALELLAAYVERTPGLLLAGRSLDPLKGLAELNRNPPDILFLDVDMPGLSGLELARILRGRCAVVLTTSFREFGPEAFELEVLDYLLKPFLYDRFLQAVQRCSEQLPKTTLAHELLVKTGIKGQLQHIKLTDIVYVTGLQAYASIHLPEAKVIAYVSLQELLTRLPADRFSRIHKSHLVSHDWIDVLEPAQVRLKNGVVLPIGRSYHEAFFRRLQPLIVSRK